MHPITANGEPGGVRYEPRIKESDTYFPMLGLLDDAEGGFLPTSAVIKSLEAMFAPEGEDAEILAGRSDTRFSQIVRNIVSHRDSPTNPIHMGLVEYDKTKRGLRITRSGQTRLVEMRAEHQRNEP